MAVLSILLIIAGIVLTPIALAVRFAGDSAILSGLRREDVADMAALNRWAGHRLLVLPALALGFGAAGLRAPILGLLGASVVALAGIVIIGWLMLGAERFRVPRQPASTRVDG